ncbi:lysis system i-spanin subunit Rz [Pseudomonas sp. QTF5]|uniref:lysis system i-spanin subunit Rz n=1 Tax=Pseudomonas sp. QTF5 TaxID=1435425 RepID=UPI0004B2C4C3|nr:lysis system i-spanin subunit Rz [Pseudomonas sp. QTF5]
MRVFDLIPMQYRPMAVGLLVAMLLGGVIAATWTVQDWRYGLQLEQQARVHSDTLTEIALASAALQRTEQDKRLALEQRLQSSDQAHYGQLTHAKNLQARLRDRLATADLRLSVLLDATDPVSGCAVPATTATGGVVHGPTRAQLDPAHAQRIIGITDAGDQGLIALAACQAYAKEVSTPK